MIFFSKLRHWCRRQPIGLGFVGYGYAVTGRRADALEKAFEWLEKAYQERSDSLAWFRFDPESKSLPTDERFATLMRKVGFTES